MSKFWQTKGFKELSASWDKKLKESGFEDIEVTSYKNREEKICLTTATNAYWQADEINRDAKTYYYTRIEECMEFMPPKERLERVVMHYVSLGHTIREICDAIEATGLSCNRHTIGFVIRRCEHKWSLRKWTRKALKLKRLPPIS